MMLELELRGAMDLLLKSLDHLKRAPFLRESYFDSAQILYNAYLKVREEFNYNV